MKILIFLVSFFFLATPITAQETTPEVINNKIEDVKDILQQIVKDSSPKETLPDDKPKCFFGTITQINDNQITINSQNQNKILQVNDETTYIDTKRLKSKLDKFKVGQTILAMGYFNQDMSLDCRRIVATETKSVENNNQIITGQIVDVSQSQSSSIFSLIPFQNKNSQGYQIKIDSKTEITTTDNKKLTPTEAIISGKKIIAVIHPDNENSQTFSATKIVYLDQNLSLTPAPAQ